MFVFARGSVQDVKTFVCWGVMTSITQRVMMMMVGTTAVILVKAPDYWGDFDGGDDGNRGYDGGTEWR